jgi:glycosyltransferase involved in cell wall biosynthesis
LSNHDFKVLFVLRTDAGVKGGGDLVQAKQYQSILESELPCKVYFAHDLSASQLQAIDWHTIQLFNISRLHENMATINGVKCERMILTPILQPGFKFDLKSLIKTIIKGLIWRRFSIKLLNQSIYDLLDRIDAFVFLSELEKSAFIKMFPKYSTKASAVFNNGVSEGHDAGNQKRIFDLLIVGRVEPKKRVNETIDTVSNIHPRPSLIYIGGLNWYHPFYCIKFFLRVLRGQVIYLGKQQPSSVFDVMKTTKTLLNFSELEVSPLVDLEALACGCNVVSTIYSFPHQPVSQHFERIDVKSNKDCESAIVSALKNQAGFEIKINTWSENSHAYLKMINNTTDRTV